MAIPNLLNPTKVRIERIERTQTRQDPLRREPINYIVRQVAFEIDAQIVWSDTRTAPLPSARPEGLVEEHIGYFVCRASDLAAIGQNIQRGDKVTKLGDRDVVLFVVVPTYGSHYQDTAGKFSLIKVYFHDRAST